MTKADWVVVIPSYDRVDILRKKTLSVLKEHKIPKNKIYIFVADDEQKKLYDDAFSQDVGHIIVGVKGLAEVRDFIFDYFPKEKAIISMDDDIRGFVKMLNPKKAVKISSLSDMFDRGFAECDKVGAKFWGVYPTANPFFMKPGISTDFKFIIGSFWGCYNPGKEIRLAKENGGMGTEKEDYTRTIHFWERDKVIVRLNDIAVQTATYKTPGGLQIGDRAARERKTVKVMMEKWGGKYIAENKSRKSDYPELRLVRQTMKNKKN